MANIRNNSKNGFADSWLQKETVKMTAAYRAADSLGGSYYYSLPR